MSTTAANIHDEPVSAMSNAFHAIVGLLHIWPFAPGVSALRDGRRKRRRVVLPRVSARWLLEFEIASGKRAAD